MTTPPGSSIWSQRHTRRDAPESEAPVVTASRHLTYADLFDWPPDGDDQMYDLLGELVLLRREPADPADREDDNADEGGTD